MATVNSLPTEMWFGTIAGQWPIYCWESEHHAMSWLRQAKPEERRRLWSARLVEPVEFEVMNPKPYLRPVEETRG